MRQQLEIMLEMQNKMNTRVHAEWAAQGYEWYRAIWIECGELMDHFGWKWWKKQSPDRDQVVLELIDIWHFGMSLMLQSGDSKDSIIDAIEQGFAEPKPQRPFLEQVEVFAGTVLSQKRFPVEDFSGLLSLMEVPFEQLFRSYVGKNVLNFFRQDNGYKDGTYRKVWAGREDNEHLVELVEEIDLSSPDFQSNLYAALQCRYEESA